MFSATRPASREAIVSKRRVVVTGLGIVSPVGSTIDSAWNSVLRGESGIGPITRFDTSAFATRIGGAVRGFAVADYISPKEARRMDEFMHYGVASGVQAVNDSGIDFSKADTERCGVITGAGIGGLATIESEYDAFLEAKGPRRISPFFIPASIINMISGHLSIRYGLRGPNLGVVTACTTSTHAIGLGLRAIQYGDADVIVAGGGEMSTTRLGIAGFSQAKALSHRAPGTAIATASLLRMAVARSSSRNSSMPGRVARGSTRNLSASG
jgi:3-oxoacyl-[acyl-carrier-protein] synthase II